MLHGAVKQVRSGMMRLMGTSQSGARLASAPAIINDTPARNVSSFHGLVYSIRSECIRFLAAQVMGREDKRSNRLPSLLA